jgi:uncharacterized protein DUF4349
MTQHLRLLLVALALALPLGCGLGSPGSSSSSGSADRRPSQAARPAPATPGQTASGQAQSGQAQAAPGGRSGSAPASSPGVNPAQLPQGTRVQRSGQLTLQVTHGRLDQTIDRVLSLVGAEGGFVAGVGPQPADADPGARTGQITFQVPTERFDEALVALRGLGQVRRFAVSGTDVSSQYVDLRSRLASAEAQRDAYLALLNRAQSIQDIVTLQNQLAPIVAQIDQLEGQIDSLNRTTTYGTITATIDEAPAPGTSPDSWGLASAAGQALHNFAAAVGFVVVVLGTVAPFVLLGGLGFLGWRTWDRRRRVSGAAGAGQQV